MGLVSETRSIQLKGSSASNKLATANILNKNILIVECSDRRMRQAYGGISTTMPRQHSPTSGTPIRGVPGQQIQGQGGRFIAVHLVEGRSNAQRLKNSHQETVRGRLDPQGLPFRHRLGHRRPMDLRLLPAAGRDDDLHHRRRAAGEAGDIGRKVCRFLLLPGLHLHHHVDHLQPLRSAPDQHAHDGDRRPLRRRHGQHRARPGRAGLSGEFPAGHRGRRSLGRGGTDRSLRPPARASRDDLRETDGVRDQGRCGGKRIHRQGPGRRRAV